MNLVFVNSTKKAMPKKQAQLVLQELQKALPKARKNLEKQITIVFLNTAKARALNHQYRQKDYATDVLSFDAGTPEELGELIMCPQVLKRQAKENHHSFRAEFTYMFLHGVLHLLGYGHEGESPKNKRDAQKMFRIQDELFHSLQKRNML